MSGPVWRRGTQGPYTCDECLRETPKAMLQGEVRESRFIPHRTLCDDCYAKLAGLIAKAS